MTWKGLRDLGTTQLAVRHHVILTNNGPPKKLLLACPMTA